MLILRTKSEKDNTKKKTKTKEKQIVIRFTEESFNKIKKYAEKEHRGIGEFVRHAALEYVERIEKVRNDI